MCVDRLPEHPNKKHPEAGYHLTRMQKPESEAEKKEHADWQQLALERMK
jgi:hypothetical protein